MRELTIKENEAGQRFDKFLAKYMKKAPKSFFYKMMRKKNITLNGKKAEGNEQLKTGDTVKLFLSEETIESFTEQVEKPKMKSKLSVIYEDDDILVVNKPSGMLSQKAKPEDISLVEHIIAYTLETGKLTEKDLQSFKPGICNRLDRNTSGLVIAGISLKGLQEMSERLKSRNLDKYYRCLAAGKVTEGSHIKGYLAKDERTNQVTISKTMTEGSSPIETAYEPIDSNGEVTLLSVKLITGKSHQIRAHLASIGHPIIGDYKYGNPSLNEAFRKKYNVKNQLLHAYSLTLSGEQTFVAKLPAEFIRVLKGEGLNM